MKSPLPPIRHTAYLVAYLGVPKGYQGLRLSPDWLGRTFGFPWKTRWTVGWLSVE